MEGKDVSEEKQIQEWLESRPEVIKEMYKQASPDHIYRLTTTKQIVLIEAYCEDRTVRVTVISDPFPFQVFGIDIDDLEKIDKPLTDFETQEELLAWALEKRMRGLTH